MAATISYEISGDPNFLRNIKYTAYLPSTMEEFENQFLLAEKVEIEFTQEINLDPNNHIQSKLEVSQEGRVIKLIYITSLYIAKKGKLTEPPSPESFFSGFRYYFKNKVIKVDNERFKELNK